MIISPIEDLFPNLIMRWNSYSFNLWAQKNPNEGLDPAQCFLSSHCAVGWIIFFAFPLYSLSLGLHHHQGNITSPGLWDAISGNTILQKAMAWKLWFIHFTGADVLVNLGRWWGGTMSARWHDRCQQPGKCVPEVQDMKSYKPPGSSIHLRQTWETEHHKPAIFACHFCSLCHKKPLCPRHLLCLKLLPSWLLFASSLCPHHFSHFFPHHHLCRTKTLHHFSCNLSPLQPWPSLLLPLMPGAFSSPSCQHDHLLEFSSFPSPIAFSPSSSSHFQPI